MSARRVSLTGVVDVTLTLTGVADVSVSLVGTAGGFIADTIGMPMGLLLILTYAEQI